MYLKVISYLSQNELHDFNAKMHCNDYKEYVRKFKERICWKAPCTKMNYST